MTRHEDVYYTCDNCGKRLSTDSTDGLPSDGYTKVEVTNTDPASTLGTQEFHLCAQHWLEVYAYLDAVAIKKGRAEEALQDELTRADIDFRYKNPGFEG